MMNLEKRTETTTTAIERSATRFDLISALSNNLLNTDYVFHTLLKGITETFGYDGAIILEVDDKVGMIKGVCAAGARPSELENIVSGESTISLDKETILSRAHSTGKPHVRQINGNFMEVENDDVWNGLVVESNTNFSFGTEESAVLPMKSNGLVNYLVYINNISDGTDRPESIRKIDVMHLREIVHYAAIELYKCYAAQELKEAAQELKKVNRQLKEKNHLLEEASSKTNRLNKVISKMAMQDDLIGIYNRKYVSYQLKERDWMNLKHGYRSVCRFDLDEFKQINDTYGHPGGDAVLKEVSNRIKKVLTGRRNIFARVGGDEFEVLMRSTKHEPLDYNIVRGLYKECVNEICEEPVKYKEKIISEDGGPITYNEFEIPVAVSAGFSKVLDDPSEARKQADRALYHAKQNGRNSVYSVNRKKFTKV